MDYDTFTKQFPSDAFLKKWAISEAEYKKKFIATFNARGFLAVGMSDVGLSKLFEAGAVVEKRGTMRIIPEKLDISERFNREVREPAHGVLAIFRTLVRDMQRGGTPVVPLVLDNKGTLAFGAKKLSAKEIAQELGLPHDVYAALSADMFNILKDDSFLWPAIGTFAAQGETVVCEPNPQMPEVARLTPRVGPKAKRLDI
jgi:hypothetical protein